MSYVACTSHGPTFEFPIVEQNAERSLRPVIIKYRKVLGKRGWMLRRIGHYLGAPRTPEGMAHAALMVGDYVHELHTDEANQKYLVAQQIVIGHLNHPPVTAVYHQLIDIIRERNLRTVTLNDVFIKPEVARLTSAYPS